jgi:16S rRNA (uracil1498-N3)-methyltransferase
MAVRDLSSQRLYVDGPLEPGEIVPLLPDQAQYLRAVLRLAAGAKLLVFNGRDGEWSASLQTSGKRAAAVLIAARTRPQENGPDVDYLFAPLKRSRLDYMVQKAVEMGAARLRPVLTRHTIAERVNLDRMRANVIEAAEQCGVLRVPEVLEPIALERALAAWDVDRRLLFCDEAAVQRNPVTLLSALQPGPMAVLIGPEGGFSAEERALLLAKPYVTALSLGPRIMRADTAAVAALALVNTVLGDWR